MSNQFIDNEEIIKKIGEIFVEFEKIYGKILYLVNTETKIIKLGYIEKIRIKPSDGILRNKSRTVTLEYENFSKRLSRLIFDKTNLKFSIIYDPNIYSRGDNY